MSDPAPIPPVEDGVAARNQSPSPTRGTPPAGARPTGGEAPKDAKDKNSTLGKVAMIIGIVGFIFAVIPGALIVGWILLPISFILGIVAMFKPGKKTFGVIAIVLAVVGTIASVIVFTASLGSAIDEALSPDEVVVEVDEDEDATEAEDEAADKSEESGEAEEAGTLGTRENPIPVGTSFASKDWEVVVNSIEPDATAEVVAANMFNDEPDAGNAYMLINLSATYLGEGSSIDSMVSVAFVDADGAVYKSSDSMTVAPDPAFGANELYTDASSTGNIAIEVPSGAEGLVRVEPGFLVDEVFVSIP